MIAAVKQTRTPVVSLSIDQAAADLDLDALGVMRLLARGRLKATRLGTSGEWRILPAELTRFIEAGAPDLAPVETDGRGWLADWPRPLGDFEQAIADAAQQALEADPQSLQRIADADEEPVEYVAPIVGALLDTAKQELPGQLAPVRELRAKFSSWAALWLAEQLRIFAKQEFGRKPVLGATPAARFFDSPDTYRAVVQAAGDRLTAQTISRLAWIPLEIDGVATKKPTKLIVPVSGLMTALGLRVPDVAELAF